MRWPPPTSAGFIYIFDRVTGESLFPMTEMKVPKSTVPGEITSPTQPVPTLPAPLAKLTDDPR